MSLHVPSFELISIKVPLFQVPVLFQQTKAWYNKGLALQFREIQGTIECYDKALEIDPKYAKALNNKALALDKLQGTKSEGKDSPDRLCDNDINNNPHRLPRLSHPIGV